MDDNFVFETLVISGTLVFCAVVFALLVNEEVKKELWHLSKIRSRTTPVEFQHWDVSDASRHTRWLRRERLILRWTIGIGIMSAVTFVGTCVGLYA